MNATIHCSHPRVKYTTREDGKLHLMMDEGITFIPDTNGVAQPVCTKCGQRLKPVLEISKSFCHHPGVRYKLDNAGHIQLLCDDPSNGLINVDGQFACKNCKKIIVPPTQRPRLMLNMR